MSVVTAKASRKMKKYAVLTREPRCFLGSFDFSWEQRKFSELVQIERGGSPRPIDDFITDAPNGLNWVKIGDAPTQGNYITKTAEKIRPEGLSKTREVHPGDLILSNSMSFGKPYIMGIDGCIHDGWLLIRNTYGVFDLTFLCHLLGTPQMLSQYRSLAAGSTVNNLNKELVGNTYVTIPSITEQRVLGAYLEQLDNLITLHQRKCALLFSPFQALISMMFTTSTFSWEQRKLSEMCGTFEYGLNAAAKEFDGKNKYIRITDIDDASREFLLSDLSSPDICLDGMSKYLLSSGDIVFARTGASVGKTYIYRENDGIVYFAGFLIRAKVNQDNDAEFVFQSTLSPSYEKYIRITSQRSGQPGVNAQEYSEYDLFAPSKEEQQRIGHFLRGIDNLITLHQRKCISFTGRAGRLISTVNKKRITSSWEQRKFEEIAVRSSVICSDVTLPRVEYEDIVSGAGRLNKDIYAKQSSKSGIAFHRGDVLYGKLRPYLQNWLLPTFDGLAVGDFWVLQPQNADSSFLYRLIQSRQFDEVANQSTGTKMPRADWKLVSKTVFSIPSNISEQAAIGTYFTALDNLITLHQRKPFFMEWRTSDANRNQTNRLVL